MLRVMRGGRVCVCVCVCVCVAKHEVYVQFLGQAERKHDSVRVQVCIGAILGINDRLSTHHFYCKNPAWIRTTAKWEGGGGRWWGFKVSSENA